jgi:hypothetical protein
MPIRRALAEFAATEMLRLFLAGESRSDFLKKFHPRISPITANCFGEI